MKVAEAEPGQFLCVIGRVPRPYTKNLKAHELQLCYDAGFTPGFLMPAWVSGQVVDIDRITPLFYLGPTWLQESVGGLKKYHVFLHDGSNIALEGYDFRHLQPLLEGM